ncbi:hypothetical protein T4D_5831 [Trichinella pseudospiralis]|uniref:Uncharacterized protein n=1 Tax=Trichinella pseudospiralis TaxID=6337 RepID=A0A0V1DRF4_TRIPS|nr:hypothetical protein T4D_5831 [Trichinella pseudospiralis]
MKVFLQFVVEHYSKRKFTGWGKTLQNTIIF